MGSNKRNIKKSGVLLLACEVLLEVPGHQENLDPLTLLFDGRVQEALGLPLLRLEVSFHFLDPVPRLGLFHHLLACHSLACLCTRRLLVLWDSVRFTRPQLMEKPHHIELSNIDSRECVLLVGNLEEPGLLRDGAKAVIRGADDVAPESPCRDAPATVLPVPVLEFLCPSIGSAEQRPIGLLVHDIAQLICDTVQSPLSEVLEMDDRPLPNVHGFLLLLHQPHVVVPVNQVPPEVVSVSKIPPQAGIPGLGHIKIHLSACFPEGIRHDVALLVFEEGDVQHGTDAVSHLLPGIECHQGRL
mmetsp:Transcript_1729/g.5011  ORF Transcript_1729/g.5011 Transcript_1729/m.5011 type:complete len:300 (+) Transcript_1729:441-1340(+)